MTLEIDIQKKIQEGYRKFLEATLPHQDPQLKGFDSVELKDWLDIVEGRKSNIEDDD